MGEVSASIKLQALNDPLGWTYSGWTIHYGKGQETTTEQVKIKCSETSQRYMSKKEATAEARGRIQLKIKKKCGDFPENKIRWTITETS